VQGAYSRDLLDKHGQKLFIKAENANVQELLTLNRIEEAVNKVIGLKLKAKFLSQPSAPSSSYH
jgi:hypothetical protein